MDVIANIKEHYRAHWHDFSEHNLNKGPIQEVLPEFCVLRFQPHEKRNSWIYASCGMSGYDCEQGLELFILAPTENDFLIELITAVAHYYASGNNLGYGHTVNFGCPWYEGSLCDHGLISLPYLDGPSLEWLETKERRIRFLWIVPITKDEVEYIQAEGLDSLENLFEENDFNYIDPLRKSLVDGTTRFV